MYSELVPLEPKIRAKRKSLADEVERASESVPLNIAEGEKRKASTARTSSGALRDRPAGSPPR
jgi:four helix bundle protein